MSITPLRNKKSCEGTEIQLKCDLGEVVKIVRANYGRLGEYFCDSEKIKRTRGDCLQKRTKTILDANCRNRQICAVNVSSQVFGDPCPETIKYLEVYYQCKTKSNKDKKLKDKKPPWLLNITLPLHFVHRSHVLKSEKIDQKDETNNKSSYKENNTIIERLDNERNDSPIPTMITVLITFMSMFILVIISICIYRKIDH